MCIFTKFKKIAIGRNFFIYVLNFDFTIVCITDETQKCYVVSSP